MKNINHLSSTLRTKISKLGTPQLIKRYNEGKFTTPEEIEIAIYYLTRRNVMDQIIETQELETQELETQELETQELETQETEVNTYTFKYNNSIDEQILYHVLKKAGLLKFTKGNKNLIVETDASEEKVNKVYDEYDALKKSNRARYVEEVTEVYKARKAEIMELEGLNKLNEVYLFTQHRSKLRKYFKELQTKFEIKY